MKKGEKGEKRTSESVLDRWASPPSAEAYMGVCPSDMDAAHDPDLGPGCTDGKCRLASGPPRRNGGPIADRTILIGLHSRPWMAGCSVPCSPFFAMIVAARGMSEEQEVMHQYMFPLHDMGPSPQEKTKPSQKNLRALHADESRHTPPEWIGLKHNRRVWLLKPPGLPTFNP